MAGLENVELFKRWSGSKNKERRIPIQDLLFATIDCGSTSIKIKAETVLQGVLEDSNQDSPWIGYQDKKSTGLLVEEDAESNQFKHPFTYISHSNLEHVLSNISDGYKQIVDQADGMKVITVLTGFTNSLAIRYQGKTALLLDDPSLEGAMTPLQRTILDKTFTDWQDKPSSLKKLLAIKNHPELLTELFAGEIDASAPIVFADIQFSTMLGVVAEKLSESPEGFVVPLDDIRGFGNKGLTPEQASLLMAELGIGPTQIRFQKSRFLPSYKEGLIFQIPDLTAEVIALDSQRRIKGGIEKNATIVGLDTIGKIITPYPSMPRYIKNADGTPILGYTTQRMTGAVSEKLLRLLYQTKDGRVDYWMIHSILKKAAETNESSEFVFYPDNLDELKRGKLFYIGSDAVLIPPETYASEMFDEADRRKMVLGIALGVAFGLRHKIETIWKHNGVKNAPIYLYGGLGANGQTGWTDILAQALPDTEIYRLDLPSGNVAAALTAIRTLNIHLEKQFTFNKQLLHPTFKRDNGYAVWKMQKGFKPELTALPPVTPKK